MTQSEILALRLAWNDYVSGRSKRSTCRWDMSAAIHYHRHFNRLIRTQGAFHA